MLQWLFSKKTNSDGLTALRGEFSQMLKDAHREMMLGCGVFLRKMEHPKSKKNSSCWTSG